MPFYFRKSIRLGSGVRMNLSKSGVGFSFGVRGARVSIGPRGTYVNVGTHGVYYRQKIGGSHRTTPSATSPFQPPISMPLGNPIPNVSADQLVDATSAAMLGRLNACIRQPAYAWMFLVGGFILAAALANLQPLLFPLIFGFVLYLAYLARMMDVERRTYGLEFHLDDAARQGWLALNTAFAALAPTQMLWRITTLDPAYDWKRNAGATALLSRVRAALTQKAAIYISSNLTPYCLDIGIQQLYFFPDRVYVYQHGTYGAIEYSDLFVTAGQTQFIESDPMPSDAQAIGATWQYVNKDGSPDRRFNNNRQLPIMNYGVVELKSRSGLNLLLHSSSLHAASQFAALYQRSRSITSTASSQASRQQTRQPPGNQQRPAAPSNPSSALPDCYRVLDLTPLCTREAAAAKYRELASSYHPDRVNHLAPEFKVLAQQKMTEINQAYAELKRIRGW